MKLLKAALLLTVPFIAAMVVVVAAAGALPYKIYVIHTGSMVPTIPVKSAVVVREHHFRIGQVVTFTEGGHTVTHRLVAISATGMTTTKGDANRSVDPWHVPRNQIIGGVVAAPRQLGYWLEYLKNPVGVASVLLSLLVCWQIWALAGQRQSDPSRRVRHEPVHRIKAPRHRIRSDRATC